MIELLMEQTESNQAFRRWAEALIAGGTRTNAGWVFEGTGVVFGNYRHGAPGTITNQVMLGCDRNFRKGVVKIVQPDTSQNGNGKLTAIGRDDRHRTLLLRQGWLKPNAISAEVREDFARLSGLTPIPVSVAGRPSAREWYVVADLDAALDEIIQATVDFTNACSRARSKKGETGPGPQSKPTGWRFGLEKGRLKKVTTTDATKEVEELQKYVWEQLKNLIGPNFKKIGMYPYEVDAVILPAKMLIEIKTGVNPCEVYEAVGQLMLYISIVDLPDDLDRVLLAPDEPALDPRLAAALATANVKVFHYSIGRPNEKPEIKFTEKFIARCRRNSVEKSLKRRRTRATHMEAE